jgi:uncharacterized protein YjiS (DUF1127 family)
MSIFSPPAASRSIFLDRIARLRTSLSERNRRARDFAAIEVLNDHALRDLGLWCDRDSPNRHLVRF